VELDPENRVDAVLEGHDFLALRTIEGPRGHFEVGGKSCVLHNEGMVPHDDERIRDPLEDPSAAVTDGSRFPVHQSSRSNHPAPIGFADRLMSETHTKNRDPSGGRTN
jgi:hypothetical protein